MVARTRWVLPVAALVLVAVIADRLPPAMLLPVAIGWNVVLAGLVIAAMRRLAQGLGVVGATVAVAVVIAAGVALTGVQWTGRAGTVLPCRRNWSWLPSYLLRSSPTHSTVGRVGDTAIKVCYGSPRSRGRTMIGSTRAPFGQLWRTGANEPTTIRASGPISIAGIAVPSGIASLYTVPGPETWEIVVNGSTSQWGIESEYPAGDEIGRRVVPSRSRAEWTEALRIGLDPDSTDRTVTHLVIQWETVEVRVPLQAIPSPSR